MDDINRRAECFCSYNQQDPNCYNAQDGFCPQKDDCEKGRGICKALFGEKAPGVSFDYSDLSAEQKQKIEDGIDAPQAVAAKRARPGTVQPSTAPVANLGDLERQLNERISGTSAPAMPPAAQPPVAPPVASEQGKKKRAGRKSNAQKQAELVLPPLAPETQPEPEIPQQVEQMALPLEKAIPEPVFTTTKGDASSGVITLTIKESLAEKLITSVCGLIDRLQPQVQANVPADIKLAEPSETPVEKKKVVGKRGPKVGSKRKGKKGK